MAADTGDNKVTLYTLTNSAADPPTLSAGAIISVPPYTMPANAPQPDTTATLDTSDGRFVNAGPQIGNSLFQVHSINSGGYARCRFYEFDTVNKQVIQSGDFGRSGTSFDFNASIAANRRKDVFVTWSSTDVVIMSTPRCGFRAASIPSPWGSFPVLARCFSAATLFILVAGTDQRWGDYSAVSLDPSDPRGLTAWIVNERIVSTTVWGSRIGRISLPPYDSSLPAVYFLLFSD